MNSPTALPATTRTARQTTSGVLLPHNRDAEEAVLGAMLLSPGAIIDVTDIITSADFYSPRHGHIFQAIINVDLRGERPDPVIVADELSRQGLLDMCGGSPALVSLQAGTPTITGAGHYARIINEHAQLRRMIGAANEINQLGYSIPHDVPAAVDQAEQILFEAAGHVRRTGISTLEDVLSIGLDRLEKLYDSGETITGVPTGFADLDKSLLGLQPGALYIVGARPAMGKSAFALNLAAHAALRAKVTTLFVSLEMSEVDLTNRLLAAETQVPLDRLLSGRLDDRDWQRITTGIGTLAGAPLRFLCTSNIGLMELRSRARHLRARNQLGLVIVDYLQLMDGRSNAETRQVEVAELSRGLKKLAVELQVPIVAVAQVSRGIEHRADKRPTLADLKESGAIEADADVVMFLYRDEIYNEHSPDQGVAEIIIAKHRQGPTGTNKLAYRGHLTQFVSLPNP